MIIFTPTELRSLAATSRAEAEEIQKGPISHFACDAVFDANTLANKYERDANALEVAITECDRGTIGDIGSLTAHAEALELAMRNADGALMQAFANYAPYRAKLEAYREAWGEYITAVAKLLIATGKVK